MFTPETIKSMLNYNEKVIYPSYNGKSGYHILINCKLISNILTYNGDMGMR